MSFTKPYQAPVDESWVWKYICQHQSCLPPSPLKSLIQSTKRQHCKTLGFPTPIFPFKHRCYLFFFLPNSNPWGTSSNHVHFIKTVCCEHSKAVRTTVGTSSEFWGRPAMSAQRTYLFLEASKAACFGEQVISPAWHFLKWQLKAELPLIRSSALCSCHQWREYGHQHATRHICKGNSKKGSYTRGQTPCPFGWKQKQTKSSCFASNDFFPYLIFDFQLEH